MEKTKHSFGEMDKTIYLIHINTVFLYISKFSSNFQEFLSVYMHKLKIHIKMMSWKPI